MGSMVTLPPLPPYIGFIHVCTTGNGTMYPLLSDFQILLSVTITLGPYRPDNPDSSKARSWVVVQQNNCIPLFYPLLLIYLLFASYPLSSVPLYLSPLSTFSHATRT